MSPHPPDDDLTRLLHGAVDDLEPRPGLDAIRSRTARKEKIVNPSRTWFLGALGGAVATAAVIGGVVLATSGEERTGEDPGFTGTPTVSDTPSAVDPSASEPTTQPEPTDTETTPDSTDSAPPADEERAVPVYYLGDTPHGPRLYREFHRTTDGLLGAANLAASGDPADPDYRSAWPEGTTFEAVHFDGTGDDGTYTVVLRDGTLRDRPAGMTEREAQLAIEQVIYSVQGTGQNRAPVQFEYDGNPIDQVLGVPTSEPLANGPILETLSLVNLSTPEEGAVVTDGTLEVTGVANSFEATVPLYVVRVGGVEVMRTFATAEGAMEPRLFPFAETLDVSDLPPGDYELVAETDDPSGGAEGSGPFRDTRTFTIE